MPTKVREELEKVLDYMVDSEADNYDEWLAEDEARSDEHIYTSVLKVAEWLRTQ